MFYAAAYNSTGDIVTAAGTVTIEVSPIEMQWHSVPSEGNNVIGLADAGAAATYSAPVFLGSALEARAVVSGFSGADHIKIKVWRK